MRSAFLYVFVCLFLVRLIPCAQAQNTSQDEMILPAPVFAVAPDRIVYDGRSYALWGAFLPAFDRSLYKSALDTLQSSIERNTLTCLLYATKPQDSAQPAQCFNESDQDIGLHMIKRGFLAAQREALQGTPYEESYLRAEREARTANLGIWNTQDPYLEHFQDLKNTLTLQTVMIVVVFLLLGGALFVTFMISLKRFRLISDELTHSTQLLNRDIRLRKRETDLITVMLLAELKTNQSKVDAFLVIYRDLLRTLQDPYADHKYLRTGEVVRTAPALDRYIYDANVGKLDGLEPDLVDTLITFYGQIDPNPPYSNLEPHMDIKDAIEIVGAVVNTAESLKSNVDKLVHQLEEQGHTAVGVAFAA